ncbi:MAG: polyprenyl synthetase family protein [Desulfarculales bacterium]|jgi:geranylgeranyl diphosphate synthase type II|nr:polyprenyl synthetase family protein [Desulfarculales bacterium]
MTATKLNEKDYADLSQYMKDKVALFDQALTCHWQDKKYALYQSMSYSLLLPGKRLRPILCLAACEAAGGQAEQALYAAVALEMIHTYSLIHDDLPAMDNDDYRRGRPSNHKVFGEALAILAGDGLLTEAFAILTSPPANVNPLQALEVSNLIARAAGPEGMVLGQALDLEYMGLDMQREDRLHLQTALQAIHTGKTGAIINASLLSGAILAGAGREFIHIIDEYSRKIGLAFQIADDILDVEGTDEALGKSAGKDESQGKLTYPALLGLEQARKKGATLVEEAACLAARLPSRPLMLLARFVMARSS